MIRNLSRRLERLERRVVAANTALSFTINFVCPQKGVVRSLILGPNGHREWLLPDQIPVKLELQTMKAVPRLSGKLGKDGTITGRGIDSH